MKMNSQHPNLWDTAKVAQRGKLIAILAYLKKDRNTSNKQPNPTSTRAGVTTTNKGQSEQNEGNNQDKSRIK